MRTLFQVSLVNMAAIVAHGIRNIEGEIIAAFLCSNVEKLAVLPLAQMLLKVHV